MTILEKMTIQIQVVVTRMNDGGLLGDGRRFSKSWVKNDSNIYLLCTCFNFLVCFELVQ